MSAVDPRQQLAELVHLATDGLVSVADALAGESTLTALGVDSIALLRVVDGIEARYDIEIDLGRDLATMDSLDGIVALLARYGVLHG